MMLISNLDADIDDDICDLATHADIFNVHISYACVYMIFMLAK